MKYKLIFSKQADDDIDNTFEYMCPVFTESPLNELFKETDC